MAIERFEDIDTWQVARELGQQIYAATAQGQFTRDYGLRDQVQRVAVSIMANIAGGFDSQTNKAFIQFLGYALCSAAEVQSHLYVALDQGYASQDEFDSLYQQAVKVKTSFTDLPRGIPLRLFHGVNAMSSNTTHKPRN